MRAAAPPQPAGPPAPTPRAGFLLAWLAFWLLLTTVAVQDHLSRPDAGGSATVWRPLLWEGTSFVVASAILALQWRQAQRHDALLDRPRRWFARNLVWLPLVAVLFVVAVYALRHAVMGVLGLPYRHAPWPEVFRYETVKFGMFYLLFVAILFGIRSHLALAAERLRAERATSLSRQAQLIQLTQQIEPHFLFNALNTIASSVHTDPALADRLLMRLANLLRAATDSSRRPESTLDEELQLLEGYAAIMVERFRERVSLRYEIDPAARSCRLPTLSLQPLLENAFRHGVERRSAATTIVVRAARAGDRLRIGIENDGAELGAAPEFGVGLANLRERLAALHGERAALTLARRDGGGAVAEIELPCGC